MTKKNSRYDAFTLVEIAIVLAVVCVLAAIVFPVVSRARSSARTSTCASNLRQIGQALALYKSDNDGFYPFCSTEKYTDRGVRFFSPWWMDIGLKPPPTCPDVDLDLLKNISTMMRERMGSYTFNRNLTKVSGSAIERYVGQPEFSTRYPGLTITAFDSRPFIFAMMEPDTARTKADLYFTVHTFERENAILQFPPGATRHQGGANYLFGDGHVKWYRPEQLSITPKNDGVHPGFGL